MKTYEEMAENALSRIDNYRTEQKKRRKTAVGIIVPVVALCVVTAAGIGIHKNNIPNQPIADENTYTAETYTTIAGVGNSNSKPEVTSGTTAQSPYDKHEGNTTIPTQFKNNKQNSGEANGVFQGVADNGSETQETTKMVSDYPGSSAACYAAPKKGEINMSVPLRSAVEEYGSGVLYRVVIDIFDGGGQVFDKNVFSSEADRLFKLGYTCAIEEINDGNETRTLFTMHSTAEQLESFTVNPDYGYMMFLYDE